MDRGGAPGLYALYLQDTAALLPPRAQAESSAACCLLIIFMLTSPFKPVACFLLLRRPFGHMLLCQRCFQWHARLPSACPIVPKGASWEGVLACCLLTRVPF